MAITRQQAYGRQRGFALLIAVIFMSVMLALGVILGSLGYKQQLLASSSIESQYAFYAADAALECGLYADQKLNLFAFSSNFSAQAPQLVCRYTQPVSSSNISHTSTEWVTVNRLSIDSGSGTSCADVTVYKYSPTYVALNPGSPSTYIFSQGYDVPCSTVAAAAGTTAATLLDGPRLVVRGLSAQY